MVPEQACGPAHQRYSTPAWKTPRPAVTATAATAMTSRPVASLRLFGVTKAPMPASMATMCGQRCQWHISQGARPRPYWKNRAPPSRAPLPRTASRPSWLESGRRCGEAIDDIPRNDL